MKGWWNTGGSPIWDLGWEGLDFESWTCVCDCVEYRKGALKEDQYDSIFDPSRTSSLTKLKIWSSSEQGRRLNDSLRYDSELKSLWQLSNENTLQRVRWGQFPDFLECWRVIVELEISFVVDSCKPSLFPNLVSCCPPLIKLVASDWWDLLARP